MAVGGASVSAAVQSVDCGLPLVDVNGLTVSTDVLCAVHVSVSNGTDQPAEVNSNTISALVGGAPLTVDASVGDALSAHVGVGESTNGIIYVRVPAGTTNLDGLTVQVN